MCKHDWLPSAEQKAKIKLLVDEGLGVAADWLIEAWTQEDHYRRAYEAEQGVHEKQGLLMEGYIREIEDLKHEVRKIRESLGDAVPEL